MTRLILARMARKARYRQVDDTIISCTKGTNETISTSRLHDSSSHEWHEWHDIDKSIARFFFARMARMARYRQVDGTILLRTNGTNIKSFLSLAKIVLFVPFVRRQVDGTIISCTKGAKLFIYARMARMKRYRQVDSTIISCTKGTNETISTS